MHKVMCESSDNCTVAHCLHATPHVYGTSCQNRCTYSNNSRCIPIEDRVQIDITIPEELFEI